MVSINDSKTLKDRRCAEIVRALASVIDPELGIDIIALGLVYAIGIEGDELDSVEVVMTLTTPGCPMHATITADAKAVIASVPWVKSAHVTLTWQPAWTPSRMSAQAREILARP